MQYKFTEDHNWFSGKDIGEYVSPQTNFTTFLTPLKDKPVRFLEIGSFEGRSAVWCLDNVLTNKDSFLDCVEVAGEGNWFYHNLTHNLSKHIEAGKCRLITDFSRSAIPKLMEAGNAYDFIYIDGAHDTKSILEDAVLSFHLMKIGGIMAFDDYASPQSFSTVNHRMLPTEKEMNTWIHSINGVNVFVPHQGLPKQAVDAFLLCYRDFIEVIHAKYQLWIRRTK